MFPEICFNLVQYLRQIFIITCQFCTNYFQNCPILSTEMLYLGQTFRYLAPLHVSRTYLSHLGLLVFQRVSCVGSLH